MAISTEEVNRMCGQHLEQAVRAMRRKNYEKVDRKLELLLTTCEALLSPMDFNNRNFKTDFREVLVQEVKYRW